jgi:hypothetical protein
MGRAAAVLLGAGHAARFAFWLGVEAASRDGSMRLWRLEQRAAERARRAEADVQAVTGHGEPASYTVASLIERHSWELDRA